MKEATNSVALTISNIKRGLELLESKLIEAHQFDGKMPNIEEAEEKLQNQLSKIEYDTSVEIFYLAPSKQIFISITPNTFTIEELYKYLREGSWN